ncbi:MAG: hypothetical protein L0Z47_05695 [Actinobacteria bacterium]|nr:hypothetical protein [Actinomycetota bacterium]
MGRRFWVAAVLVLVTACSESLGTSGVEVSGSVLTTDTPGSGAPESTIVTTVVVLDPIDGRPEDLGVASIDFITAMFPTSPVEHRVSAAWMALRYNVEQSRVAECMADQGLVLVPDRITAAYLRRNGDMPDFQLDAERGIWEPGGPQPGDPGPRPPSSASAAEAEAWNQAYFDCGNGISNEVSGRFDSVIGQVPFWFGIVDEVNNSSEMKHATDTLLSCVAEGGGPQVDRVVDIYLYLDTVVQGSETKDEALGALADMATLVAGCAGDYDAVRQALLIPKRDEIVAGYSDVLAEAELYFNEVMAVGFGD